MKPASELMASKAQMPPGSPFLVCGPDHRPPLKGVGLQAETLWLEQCSFSSKGSFSLGGSWPSYRWPITSSSKSMTTTSRAAW